MGDGGTAAGLDTSTVHPARRYNYWLGGKDHFAVDRASGDLIEQAFPAVRVSARENREFLRRAVRFLAGEAGIDQFLDIGTGLPTADNTHQVAQAISPAAHVVYVDNDPMVMAHARALLTSTPGGRTRYLEEDLRHPDRILGHPEVAATLDLGRPVALMLVAVLHFIPDQAEAREIVGYLMDALPAGSFLVASNATLDFVPTEAAAVAREWLAQGRTDAHHRDRDEFAEFFAGLYLVEPGIVPVSDWRADRLPAERPTPDQVSIYGGMGRKS
jgi:hypothetical protein